MINKQLFNADKPPAPDSREFVDYWKEEVKRCKYGYSVGGKFMTGLMYFYANYWKIQIDATDPISKKSYKTFDRPLVRDVEWEIFDALERAEREEKGLMLITGRGQGKSYWGSCFIGHGYTFIKQNDFAITAGWEDDIKPLSDKTRIGLENLPAVFKQKTDTHANWSDKVQAAYKDPEGNVMGNRSTIHFRNYKNGSNAMACNGLRLKRQVIEEVGKIQHLIACHNATEPCWKAGAVQYGTPFYIGTGGDMEKGQDSEKMFFNPDAYNLITFDNTYDDNAEKICLFFPAIYALNQFKDEQGVTDKEKALEYITKVREQKRKAKDKTTYIRELMYNPLKPEEAFLTESGNIFDTQRIQEDMFTLNTSPKYRDIIQRGNLTWVNGAWSNGSGGGDVKWEPDPNGVFQIYEHPVWEQKGVDFVQNLYVAGTDPYNLEAAVEGSLGSSFVFKRMHTINDTNNLPVAQYTDRPRTSDEYFENLHKLLCYYKCKTLYENNIGNTYSYFNYKKALHFLLENPTEIVRDAIIKPKHVSTYGIRMLGQIKDKMLERIAEYIKINCGTGYKNVDGEIVKEPGNIRFPDLLDELLRFNSKRGNYDRVMAFGLALLHNDAVFRKQVTSDVGVNNAYKIKTLKNVNGRLVWTYD